ncbi:MAG: nucleotidyltransferase domain-containing protein, partial [Sphingorhabdus sp.]
MTENGLGRRRQRDIIDRNAVADEISAVLADSSVSEQRSKALAILQTALREGREEISRRLIAMPSTGRSSATDQAFLIDQIIRVAYDFVTTSLFPVANRSAAEKIAVVAVGGYGRGEMAPHSDVDIAFITPYKRTGWTEQVVEAMLYFLWDLGLKVGQSSRSIDETIKMALEDLTIRTALLEGRFVWGDREVYE